MEIWLDTTHPESVRRAQNILRIHGITTNPALIRQGGKAVEETLQELLEIQKGPVTVQVTADLAEKMLEQALEWCALSPRLIIKVPVTKEGYEATRLLRGLSRAVMATVLFHPHQALLAAQAGAAYVAPYVTRMEKAGLDSIKTLKSILQIYANYAYKTKVLAASLSTVEQIVCCAELGVHAMTLKEAMLDALLQDNPENA